MLPLDDLKRLSDILQSAFSSAGYPAEAGLAALPQEIEEPFEPGAAHHPEELASYIDHTLLKADATPDQIVELCREARTHLFASVCINPLFIETAARELKDSESAVCTVIGFPLGASTASTKAAETRDAVAAGADELDMVLPIGLLKGKDYPAVLQHILAVREASADRLLKVILETGLLTEEEKAAGCLISKAAGADFVKTSTGFAGSGATVEDIVLMRQVVGYELGVKASGGVRDRETAIAMIEAGATRIGASASLAIIGAESAGAAGY